MAPATRTKKGSSKSPSLLYVVTLKDAPADKAYIKLGKCTASPWRRFRYGSLSKIITPRGYKKQVADTDNLKVLGCFSFPTKSDVDIHRIERLFHKTHRETARCGEWYPAKSIHDMRRFLVRFGARTCRVPRKPRHR